MTDLSDRLRKTANAVYLVVEVEVADALAETLTETIDRLDTLEAVLVAAKFQIEMLDRINRTAKSLKLLKAIKAAEGE